MEALSIYRHNTYPDWNYTLEPPAVRGAKGGRNKTKLGRRLKGSCEGI
jgi:hypothetical protein